MKKIIQKEREIQILVEFKIKFRDKFVIRNMKKYNIKFRWKFPKWTLDSSKREDNEIIL